jgi:hypothetical protein
MSLRRSTGIVLRAALDWLRASSARGRVPENVRRTAESNLAIVWLLRALTLRS